MRLACITAALALLVTGCAGPPMLAQGPGAAVTRLTELPPPTGVDLASQGLVYRVAPYDKLAVVVADMPDLTGKFQTDSTGRFSLPYVGTIDAAGHTTDELAGSIGASLRGKVVRNPHVAVNIEEATSQSFTVDGQVTQPGNYPMTAGMTLIHAIAAAKGAGEFARVEDVVVFRTVEGKPMAAIYNLGAIRTGRYADPRIWPGDKIVVGDSAARRRFQQFLQIMPLLITPIVLTLEHCC